MKDRRTYEMARKEFDRYASLPTDDFPDDELSELQVLLARWQNKNLSQPLGAEATAALGMGEEAGELQEALIGELFFRGAAISAAVGRVQQAVLKHSQGIRGLDDIEAYRIRAADAIADTMVFATQLCTALRIDFGELYRRTVAKVVMRKWKEDPANATVGEETD